MGANTSPDTGEQMEDDQTTPPADPSEVPPTPPPAGDQDPAAEAEKWKQLARKHEQRAKENADKAKKYDDFEEASKSEQQKLAERASRAEAELAAALLKAERAEIAAAKGVPVELLAGSTREELEAAADKLLAFKGTAPKAPPATGQGDSGPGMGSNATQMTRSELSRLSAAGKFEEIDKARAEGRLDDVLTGKSN